MSSNPNRALNGVFIKPSLPKKNRWFAPTFGTCSSILYVCFKGKPASKINKQLRVAAGTGKIGFTQFQSKLRVVNNCIDNGVWFSQSEKKTVF